MRRRQLNNTLRQHDLTTREKSHIDFFLFQIIKMGATEIQHRISSGAFSSRMDGMDVLLPNDFKDPLEEDVNLTDFKEERTK